MKSNNILLGTRNALKTYVGTNTIIDYFPYGNLLTLGPELATNTDFETGVSGWTAKDGVISYETSSAITGTGSLRFDNSTGNSNGGPWQNMSLSSEKTYRVEGSYKMISGDGDGTVRLISSSGTGTSQSTVYIGDTIPIGEIVNFNVDFTPISPDVSFQLSVSQTNSVYLVDNISVKQIGARKQSINIDYEFASAETNFPMLITLDHLNTEMVDGGTNSALNGGGDLRFYSDLTLTTQIPCDVVNFITNATEGARRCEIWVKIPTINTGTTIYVTYNQGYTTQPISTDPYGRDAVWADYHASYHLQENTTDTAPEFKNSEGTSTYDLNETSITDVTVANYGKGVNTTGTSYLRQDTALTPGANFTLSFRIQFLSSTVVGLLYSNVGTTQGFALNTNLTLNYYDGTDFASTATLSENVWYNIDFVISTSTTLKMYIDGVLDSTHTISDISTNPYRSFGIQDSNLTSFPLDADIEHIRITNNARLAPFLLAEKTNHSSPTTFASPGISSNMRLSRVDADYQSILNRADVLGYAKPSVGQQAIQNQLVLDLKSDGIWATKDVIYVPANDGSEEFGNLNWKSPSTFELIKSGSVTWTWNVGYQGDGIDGWIDTTWDAQTNGVNYLFDDASINIWIQTMIPDLGTEGPQYIFGGGRFGADTNMRLYHDDTSNARLTFDMHTGAFSWLNDDALSYLGLLTTSIKSGRTNEKRLTKGGTNITQDVVATALAFDNTNDIVIGAHRTNGTIASFSTVEWGWFSLGSASTSDQIQLNKRITAYMTLLPIQLYQTGNPASIGTNEGTQVAFGEPWHYINVTITADTSDPYSGTYALKMEDVSANAFANSYLDIPIINGKNYSISMWAKAGTIVDTPSFSGMTNVSGFTETAIVSTDWTEYTWNVTATTTGISQFTVRLNVGDPLTAGSHVYLDDISIIEQ